MTGTLCACAALRCVLPEPANKVIDTLAAQRECLFKSSVSVLSAVVISRVVPRSLPGTYPVLALVQTTCQSCQPGAAAKSWCRLESAFASCCVSSSDLEVSVLPLLVSEDSTSKSSSFLASTGLIRFRNVELQAGVKWSICVITKRTGTEARRRSACNPAREMDRARRDQQLCSALL